MGATKVVVLVGEIIDDSELSIIGHSVVSSDGKKGVIVDLQKLATVAHAAIISAERNSRRRVMGFTWLKLELIWRSFNQVQRVLVHLIV